MKQRIDRPLPKGWAWTKLGEIGDYLNGRAFSKSEWTQTGRMIVRIQDLTGTGSKPNYFEGSVESRYEIYPGDLLVSWAATLGAYIWRGPEAVLNQHIFKVRSHINAKFHYYLLQSVLEDLKTQTHGTGMVHITRGKFDAFDVPIPPLPEQERIVNKIENLVSHLEASVKILKTVKKKLSDYRAAVLNAACKGRLVPTEAKLARTEGRGFEPAEVLLGRIAIERNSILANSTQRGRRNQANNAATDPGVFKLPPNPEGWSTTNLAEITDPARVICYGILMPKDDIQNGIPYVRVVDMKTETIRVESLRRTSADIASQYARSSLRPNDLLLSIRGTYGRVAKVPPELQGGNITQDTARIAINRQINADYIAIFLRSPACQEYLRNVARGVAIKGVNIADVRAMPIPIPPAAEQERIVTEVERRLSIIQALEISIQNSLQRATALHLSLLKGAFEGKLLPQSPNDEPASKLLERIRETRSITNGSSRRESYVSISRRGASGFPIKRSRPDDDSQSVDPRLRNGIEAPKTKTAPHTVVGSQFIAPPAAATEPASGKQPFVEQDSSEQAELVWKTLLGRGPLGKGDAVWEIAQELKEQGLAQFQRLRRDGPLFTEIASTLDRGVRQGFFDRPKRGYVRAILPDPKAYSLEHWRLCLLGALDEEPVEEEDALRAAAEWARENMGLEFVRLREDGVILQGLRAALKEAVKRGEITRRRNTVFRSAP